MTDAHQDVAGVVESLPERLRVNTCRFGYESEADAARRRIATDLEAASLIESLSKALSEAEAQADKYCEWWREKRNECMAAESRLAEAMEVIEPFAKAGSMLNFAGATEQDEVELSGEQLHEALRAARRFLNAGKE